jgi:hypothetical protein
MSFVRIKYREETPQDNNSDWANAVGEPLRNPQMMEARIAAFRCALLIKLSLGRFFPPPNFSHR